MSNGNVKLVDNAKDWQGKHQDILLIQRKIAHFLLTTTAKTRHAYSVWSHLREQAGGEYNATINNIARDLHMSAKTVTQAQELLVKLGLLKIEEEAELTGEKRLVTGKGITVKNNKALYTVFATSEQIISLMSKQTAVVEEVPKAQEVQAEAVKVVASPAAVSPSRDERLKAREEEIREIGRRFALSVKQREALVQATKEFAAKVKRKATEAEIGSMANLLSSESSMITGPKAVSDFIWRKALSK